MIFVNFKAYPEGTGQDAVKLSQVLVKVSEETGIPIIPVVQSGDIKEVSSVSETVWAQHIDPVEFGAHTGSVIAEAVKEDGASGTFLNHSEKKFFQFEDLSKAVTRAKQVGLETLIFAADTDELDVVVRFKPTYLAYEPPELVGSTTRSVATARPDVIVKAATIAQAVNIPLIVGAGVHTVEDVATSLKLGAQGIAIATGIVKAGDPEKELRELINGFKK